MTSEQLAMPPTEVEIASTLMYSRGPATEIIRRLVFQRDQLLRRLTPECRRCGDCRDSSHHWIEKPLYICKHCRAIGEECLACRGYDEGESPTTCVCGAEGVVQIGVRTKEQEG